jgi:hypothetical protein
MKVERRKEEFYCGECNKYFLTYLRTNMDGQYTIQCPTPDCKHHHFRVVRKGLVTSDRCNHLEGQLDILIGLASTLRDTPWHNDPAFRRSQMKAI